MNEEQNAKTPEEIKTEQEELEKFFTDLKNSFASLNKNEKDKLFKGAVDLARFARDGK